jgi:hypothetical protein
MSKRTKTKSRCGAGTAADFVGRAVSIALATWSVGCAVSMRAPQVDSRAEVSVAVNAIPPSGGRLFGGRSTRCPP